MNVKIVENHSILLKVVNFTRMSIVKKLKRQNIVQIAVKDVEEMVTMLLNVLQRPI